MWLSQRSGAEPIAPELPYLWAEVVFAIRHEMARTVSDILTRRIPVRFLHAAAAAPQAGELLVAELGLSTAETDRQLADFRADVAREARDLGIDR
ncbi:glycerol-3-phosphate dehydrogenase C-terminal domain-containing protein [Brooklawnia sp.]|uniref:glycerol-3-phosphate dehydrogenase C-terminal domain-containing protein n=1 Tax=Propionibacteriales TaxID=85009 RepID=UPI00311EF382